MFPFISQYIRNTPGATENIRNNYPIFLDFLTAYYAWMEQSGGAVNGIMNLLDQRDIDNSLNQFIKYFEYEFLTDIPTTLLTDPRKLAKHIKDFYLARGAEKSFKLLFRILYNDFINFYYPKTDLMKLDNGKWSIDTVIRTTTTNDTYQFIGRQVVGSTSGATANVENVLKLNINGDIVSEIYISNVSFLNTFQIGETINVTLQNNTTLHETIYGIATGIDIDYPGTAYKSGDLITVTGSNQTALFAVNIISGILTGRVVHAAYENYPQPPSVQLASDASNIDNAYIGMPLTIIDGSGIGQTKQIIAYSGSQQVAIMDTNWNILPDITSHYSISLGNIKTIKAKDFGYNYSSPIAANFTLSGNGDATGLITVGAVGYYAGRYINDDGFLDYRKYIQDSYYYQDFSYVLKVHETLAQYVNVVKKILHPAGLIMFGDVILDGLNLQRKIHNISGTVIPTITSGPTVTNLEVQYDMLEGSDPQLLYDVSAAFPTGYNATLGSIYGTDINDPSWETTGVLFDNTFINARVLPINNLQQTIIVVAKVNTLQNNSGLIGSIDNNNDSGVTGFQIFINADGSLTFRSQKMNPIQNNLTVSYPSGSINATDYFFASLRYLNNTIVGNLNRKVSILNTYGTDVDSTSIISNSRGYYLGIGGYHPSLATTPPLYGSSLYGSTLPGIPLPLTLPVTIMDGYFGGIISYVIVYNRFLIDSEITNTYHFLKNELVGRGISLP